MLLSGIFLILNMLNAAWIDNYNGHELGELMEKYDIQNPGTNNHITFAGSVQSYVSSP